MAAHGEVLKGNTYEKYGASHGVERRLVGHFLATVAGLAEAAAPASVVEVGAGEGEVARLVQARLPGAPLAVVDLPSAELAGHWRAAGLSGAFGDAQRLPLRTAAADLVLGIELLEHVPDPRAALRELARVSAGYVLVSVPREPLWRLGNMARGRYLRDLGNTPGHLNHWSAGAFVYDVGAVLEVVAVRTPPPWTVVLARHR